MKIGLFFGSFNPVHVGHLIIANYMVENHDFDKVWLVISPQNPLKNKAGLLADYHRLALCRLAVEDNPKIEASNIEFGLSQPNYTVDTLAYLKEKFPNNQFSIIMGEDNLRTLYKWKNYEVLLENYKIFVYPRDEKSALENIQEDSPNDNIKAGNNLVWCGDVPLMKISSSYIRESIKTGNSPKYLLTEPVLKYLEEMNFYEK